MTRAVPALVLMASTIELAPGGGLLQFGFVGVVFIAGYIWWRQDRRERREEHKAVAEREKAAAEREKAANERGERVITFVMDSVNRNTAASAKVESTMAAVKQAVDSLAVAVAEKTFCPYRNGQEQ